MGVGNNGHILLPSGITALSFSCWRKNVFSHVLHVPLHSSPRGSRKFSVVTKHWEEVYVHPKLLCVRVLQHFPEKMDFQSSDPNPKICPWLKMLLFKYRINFYCLLFAYLKEKKCLAGFDISVFKLEKKKAKYKNGAPPSHLVSLFAFP